MGRYYNGDIDGKFWFGLQSSDAASRFGGEQIEPNYISYCFDKDEHLQEVEEEISNIISNLGDKKIKLQEIYDGDQSFNKEKLALSNITEKDLEDFADLLLGIQIRDCIIEKGYCNFDAEL